MDDKFESIDSDTNYLDELFTDIDQPLPSSYNT